MPLKPARTATLSLSLSAESEINLQLIVIDDGSTDSSLQVAQKYAQQDKRILLLHQHNQGVGAARENGLNHVTGSYIAFCDPDDWVEPDWLVSMYTTLKQHDADFVVYGAIKASVHRNPDEQLVWDRNTAICRFLEHKHLNGTLWTKLFRASLFSGVHFDPRQTNYEDGDVVWQVLQKADKVVRVNDAKYHWQIDGDSLSNGRATEGRIRSAVLFVSKVEESVRLMPTRRFDSLADRFCRSWLYSHIKQMYRADIRNASLEHTMLARLRRQPLNTLRAQKATKDKLFASLAMLCPPLARQLFNKLA